MPDDVTKILTTALTLPASDLKKIHDGYAKLYFWSDFWRGWVDYLQSRTGVTYMDILLIEDCVKLAEKHPDEYAVYCALNKIVR